MAPMELAFDKCGETERFAFRKTFMRDPENLTVDIYAAPATELHEKRGELRKMAKQLIDRCEKEKRNMTTDEDGAFKMAMALLEDIALAFRRQDDRAQGEKALLGIHGVQNNNSLEMWQDVATGRSIPVLNKEHRLHDFARAEFGGGIIEARDYFAALVGHKVSPEVRAALSEGSPTAGGYMVPELVAAHVIDLMRAKNTCIAAGAKTIPLPGETVRVCRITSDPVASWVAENNLIPDDTAMAIGAVNFSAKKLTCLVKASTELLQDAGNSGAVIMNAIATAMGGELDRAALFGDGAGEPTGIFNDSDICSYSLGTDGATLHGFEDILNGIKEITAENGPIPTNAIMAPRTLVGYSLLKDGNGLPLQRPDLIKNMAFHDTTKIPVNQVQGGSGEVCSSIILGGFDQLVIGIRLELEIKVLRERYAEYGQVGFLATMRADTATYQPKAFCKVYGIKP